jgi:hypothetical protein
MKKSSAEEGLNTRSGYYEETRRDEKKKLSLNTSRIRAAKTKAQEEYTAVNKEVRQSIRKDTRNHIDELAKQVEEAAGQENLKKLYMVTRKLSNKFQKTETSERRELEPSYNS